jgi:hypothetical protein
MGLPADGLFVMSDEHNTSNRCWKCRQALPDDYGENARSSFSDSIRSVQA